MRIILASQSPRRKFLLEQMGLTFDVIPSNFEEYFDDDRSAEDVACELALGKARAVAEDAPGAIVIGSDLIVVLDGKQIGKPENEDQAKAMLKALSYRTHEIITAVAVICKDINYEKVAIEKTLVTFDKLSDTFIEAYVATGSTLDKAGGYAIQHPLMRPHVKHVEGRLDTVIGLPTTLVSMFLSDFGQKVEPLQMPDIRSSEALGYFE